MPDTAGGGVGENYPILRRRQGNGTKQIFGGRPSAAQTKTGRGGKTAAAVRDSRSSLVSRLVTWPLIVRGLSDRDSAISRSLKPAASRRRTSASRAVSPAATAR